MLVHIVQFDHCVEKKSLAISQENAVQAYGKPKAALSPGESSALNLGSGLMAGFAAAIISQPADTLLSKINKTKAAPGETVASRLVKMSGQLGVKGLFTGLGARYVGFHSPV